MNVDVPQAALACRGSDGPGLGPVGAMGGSLLECWTMRIVPQTALAVGTLQLIGLCRNEPSLFICPKSHV